MIKISSHLLATFGIWLPMQWTTWIVWQMGSTSDDRRNIMNDTRIKRCIARFDAGSYNRIQFLRAVSHSLGAHTDVFRPSTNSDSDIDISVNQQSTPQSVPQTSSPTTDPPAQSAAAAAATPSAPETTCEVCLRLHLYPVVTHDFVAIALIRCVPWMLLVCYAARP
jgi:hypothetical protein